MFLSTATLVAHGADFRREYGVRTPDRLEYCSSLNRAVRTAKVEDDWGPLYGFSLYMKGYLTAVNRLAHDTYDIGGRTNSKMLMLWLQQYCAENPEATLAVALQQLTLAHYPERLSVNPLRAGQ